MNGIFKRQQILTIPNMLSIFRILLLPFLIWQYCFEENYVASVIILLASGLSDIADGIIARRYNMVSDFGKIIDPIADKLTQCTMLVCLAVKHKVILVVAGLFVLKEAFLALVSYITMKKKNCVNGARWYGKLNTIIIYSVIVVLIMFPNIPSLAVNIMAGACLFIMIVSFLLYMKFFKGILNNVRSQSKC